MIDLLLAHPWTEKVDPTGWWMSEKLDGVRAYWDGAHLWSRNGKEFFPPAWWTDGLPAGLDGELFIGRGEFQATVSAVRKKVPVDAEWDRVFFLGFDLFDQPHDAGAAVEERWASLEEEARVVNESRLLPVPQVLCTGLDHLVSELDRVRAEGGEGLMLRKPGSQYEHGRSRTLLKVKVFEDLDATVAFHIPGKGKHLGRLGALRCVLDNGIEVDVGTGLTDKERESPPALGARIVLRYQELTRDGVPRFPIYVGERAD